MLKYLLIVLYAENESQKKDLKNNLNIFISNLKEQVSPKEVSALILKNTEVYIYEFEKILGNFQKNSLLITNSKEEDILGIERIAGIEDILGIERIAGIEDILGIESILDIPVLGVGLDYRGTADYVIDELQNLDFNYLNMVYNRFYNIPCVVFETENLYVKEISVEALDELYKVYDSLKECQFVESLYERSREEEFTKNYIKNMYGFFGYGLWLVYRKKDNVLIGRAGIENREIDGVTRQEIGYLIGKQYQKMGYAYEVCQKILDYAKEYLGLEELFILTEKNNIPSKKLAGKLGFSFYAECDDGMEIYYKEINEGL